MKKALDLRMKLLKTWLKNVSLSFNYLHYIHFVVHLDMVSVNGKREFDYQQDWLLVEYGQNMLIMKWIQTFSASNLLRSRLWLSTLINFCHSFPSSAILLSATYFSFFRSLSRCILFLLFVLVPLILSSVISCSNNSRLSTCPNHTFAFSHCVQHGFSFIFSVELPHYLFCHPTNFLYPSPMCSDEMRRIA